MHDVCLVGVSGSGKGYLSDLCKPSGLDVRMFSASWSEPWLPRGLPPSRYYVRSYRVGAWQTILNRKHRWPAVHDQAATLDAQRVFREGWQAIDHELMSRPHITLEHADVKADPQAAVNAIADLLRVDRWTAPDIEVYDNGGDHA